jgi:hypothetical protein
MAKLAPPKESLKPDSPLRLSVAAAIAFPDGFLEIGEGDAATGKGDTVLLAPAVLFEPSTDPRQQLARSTADLTEGANQRRRKGRG